MKIRSKLNIGFGLFIFMMIAVILGSFYLSAAVKKELESSAKAQKLSHLVAELSLLTESYLANPEPRIEIQWHSRFERIRLLLEETQGINDPQGLDLVLASLEKSFETLLSLNKERDQQTMMDDGARETERLFYMTQRIATRMRIDSQNLLSRFFVLAESTQNRALQLQRRNSVMITALGFFTMALAILVIFPVARKISKKMERLAQGAESMGRGEFDHRIAIYGNDETSVVAAAFNQMADDIKDLVAQQRLALEKLNAEIQERQKIQNSLIISEARYRELLEKAPIPIFINRENCVVFVNDACLSLFGAERPEEILGKSPFDLFRPEYHSLMRERIHRLNSKGETVPFVEDKIVRLDGRQIDVEVTAAPIKDEGVNSLHVVLHDITRRKAAEQGLEQTNAELRMQKEEIERFTYAVSHDLRSPLVTVQTFLGYLIDDLRIADQQRIEKDLYYIQTAAEKMGQLLGDLLEMSRIGRITHPPTWVPFRDLLNEVLAILAGSLAHKNVDVVVTQDELTLYGDRFQLTRVWQNLVENSTKYMGDQSKPRIEIGFKKMDTKILFYVQDNGMGLEADALDRIFGFFKKINPQSEGSGLGLALVKRIIGLYGGRIWVESQGLGQGACFYFTLPEAVTERKII